MAKSDLFISIITLLTFNTVVRLKQTSRDRGIIRKQIWWSIGKKIPDLNKELQAGQGALGQKLDLLTSHVLQMTTHPPFRLWQSLIVKGGIWSTWRRWSTQKRWSGATSRPRCPGYRDNWVDSIFTTVQALSVPTALEADRDASLLSQRAVCVLDITTEGETCFSMSRNGEEWRMRTKAQTSRRISLKLKADNELIAAQALCDVSRIPIGQAPILISYSSRRARLRSELYWCQKSQTKNKTHLLRCHLHLFSKTFTLIIS